LSDQFSIVMPVRDEFLLLRCSLPSCYSVEPDEVVVCLDSPPHQKTYQETRRIAKDYGWTDRTEILKVPRNHAFRIHQAWVRRQGYRRAKHDRILTVDADLVINRNVLRAVSIVGKNNVGLASCATLHSFRGAMGPWRMAAHWMADRLRPPALTGLYALWRPFWLDTEDNGIELLENPKTDVVKRNLVLVGEDAYLCNCMKPKHRCIHLRDAGGYSLRSDCNDNAHVQFELGRYYAESGLTVASVFARTLAFGRPHLLRGYIYQRNLNQTNPVLASRRYRH
jgi:hypothetical protein